MAIALEARADTVGEARTEQRERFVVPQRVMIVLRRDGNDCSEEAWRLQHCVHSLSSTPRCRAISPDTSSVGLTTTVLVFKLVPMVGLLDKRGSSTTRPRPPPERTRPLLMLFLVASLDQVKAWSAR